MVRILLGLLLCLGPASAATLEGATLPDSYRLGGQVLSLNGLGLRTLTIFHVHVYVAGLYVARRSHDAQEILASSSPKVLLLQFLHSGSQEQVQRQFRNGEVVNCGNGGCNPEDEADFNRMVATAPAVNVGDTFTFELTQQGVRFYWNNRLLAQSVKPDLGRLILLGFIGSRPPSEELREHLLGATG